MNIVLVVHSSAGEVDWGIPLIEAQGGEANVFVVALTQAGERSLLTNQFVRDRCESVWELIGLEVFVSRAWRVVLRKLPSFIRYTRAIVAVDRYLSLIWYSFRLAKIEQSSFTLCFFAQSGLATNPALRSFMLERFSDRLILYVPHSPHLYVMPDQALKPQWETTKFNNLILDNSEFNVSGWAGDREKLASKLDPSLPWLVVGYPKRIKAKGPDYSEACSDVQNRQVAVLSRGVGSYLSADLSAKLKNAIVNVANGNYTNLRWRVKLHPRENSDWWKSIVVATPALELVDTEVVKLISESDLVISMWSSAELDCYYQSVPCVEFFDHVASAKVQISKGLPVQDSMMYRDLGIVMSADNEEELREIVESMLASNFAWTKKHVDFLDAAVAVNSDFVADVAGLLRSKQTGKC